ncbi:organic cation transporter -like, partial [Paramuricea clavata]
FSISFGYLGLVLSVSRLAGNKYLNFFISGALEFAMTWLVTFYVIGKFGRQKPMSFYAVAGGISCILAGVLSKDTDALRKLTTAFALCGRVCIGGIWSVIFIYTSELYPTVIRNVGLGTGVFCARVGNIVAPQILLLGEKTQDYVPFIIFGSCMLLTGTFALFLPETLNMRLAETIEEAGVFKKVTEEPTEPQENGNDSQLSNVRVEAHDNVVSISDEGQ